MKRIFVTILIATQFLLISCSSIKLVDTWKDRDYEKGKINKIIVAVNIKDELKRRVWEDDFVKHFSSCGVVAEPSYKYYDNEFIELDSIKTEVITAGFNGVFVFQESGIRKNTYQITEKTKITENRNYRQITRNNANSSRIKTIERDPARRETEIISKYIANLFVLNDKPHKVWTASSEGIRSESANDTSNHLSELIANDLKAKNIF